MALYTDGPACTSEHLRSYESGILDVASSEAVELGGKIAVAQQEVGFELTTFLLQNGAEWLDEKRALSKVVLTDALRHWVVVHALAAVYRDAYYRQLNDRYKEKWAQYSLLTRTAKEQYFDVGVGVVLSPIPKPPAPTCRVRAGGTLPSRTYFVAIGWLKGLVAGEASDPVSVEPGSGELVQLERGEMPPAADGWIVYAGPTADGLSRQTPDPITGDEWNEPDTGIAGNGGAPLVQVPETWVLPNRRLQRG